MKLGLIAMSGVRAWNQELTRAGLNMPGIAERWQTVAALPSLSLLTLAGLTPPDVEVSYHEIADLRSEGFPAGGFDLAAISSMTAQIADAYRVADRMRAGGARVVMGGLHVTTLPEEALEHCDTVVVGEAEALWPRVLADVRSERLQRTYRAGPGEEFDLAGAPMPRFELLDPRRYNRLTVQTQRGCPHRCDFCASSILLTRGYKVKPVERVVAEIRRIKELWATSIGGRVFIELADDNSFCNRAHARRLLEAIRDENISWFTETDISIADDPELIDLLRESGCRQVLIGLESPDAEGLRSLELRRDWKLKQFPRYEAAIRTIQSRGVTVNGCFVLGLDAHTPAVFDAVHDFALRTGLFDVQLTVQTAFPGTPLYARLEREGRLIDPRAWHTCTLFDVNFVPRHMGPDQLQRGLLELAGRVFHPEAVRGRREAYFRGLDRGLRRSALAS